MRQVKVLPHWNDSVAGIWQDHPTQSHYKLTPGRPAIFPSTYLSMPSVSKGVTCTIFLRLLVCRGWGSNPQPSEPQANALPLHPPGRFMEYSVSQKELRWVYLLFFIWYCRPNIFTQFCNISDKIFKWSPKYNKSTKGTQKSLCAGFHVSVIYTYAITIWSSVTINNKTINKAVRQFI